MRYNIPSHLKGLSQEEVNQARANYGFNQLAAGHKSTWNCFWEF